MTAVVRPQLGRLILQNIIGPNDNLPVLTLDPSLEQLFADLVSRSENPSQIALEPNLAEDFFGEIKTEAEKAEEGEGVAVLVVSPAIRPWLSKMLWMMILIPRWLLQRCLNMQIY